MGEVEHYPGVVGDFCEFVKFKDGVTRCRLCGQEYDPDAPPAEWEEPPEDVSDG